MQTDLEKYRNDQASVVEYLKDGVLMLEKMSEPEVAKPLERLQKSVQEGLFSIVLVGEFSAGKSTFLNALMHKYILPSFSGETTATVNFLRHKDKAPIPGLCGRVYRLDGTEEDIHDLTVDTLERVVSTRGNTDDQTVATTIDRVELFLDSEFLHEGVQLVDSPGLNGTADHHREITEQQIKSSHASIFVFNAEHPGTHTDFEYLRYLKSQSNNIFFVLNKIDSIKASEKNSAESIIQGLRKTYHDKFPEETTLPKIWPLSAGFALGARDPSFEYRAGEYATTQEKRDDLEKRSRMAEFESRLIQYLTHGQRAHDQLCEPLEKAIGTFVRERDRLDAQIQMLQEQTSGEELSAQKEAIESELQSLKNSRQSISASVRQEVQRILRDLEERARSQCAHIQSKVSADLEICELPEEVQDYASKLNGNLPRRFSGLVEDLTHRLHDELLETLSTEYQNYADSISDRFAELSSTGTFQMPDAKIVVQEITGSVNLEQFDKECADLQAKIDKITAEEQSLGLNKLAARKAERDRLDAKAELDQLRASKNLLLDTFVLPDVEYRDEEVQEKHWRGGLFGKILTPFIGKKVETKNVTIKDDSVRVEAKKRHDSRIAELNAEITAAEQRLNTLQASGVGSDEAEMQQLAAQRKLEALEKELQDTQVKFREQLVQSTEKVTKRMRRDVSEQAESLAGEAENGICEHLRGMEKQMVCAVQELLNQTLRAQIELKQNQLEQTIAMLQTEGEARDKLLDETKQMREQVQAYINRGGDLRDALDKAMQDKVEQEAFESDATETISSEGGK
jgi:GTP-binding protein EngB required for normal cell division